MSNESANEVLLTEKEVADHYRVTVYTVRRWRREGRIGSLKVGKQSLYRQSDLAAFEKDVYVAPVVIQPRASRRRAS